MGSQSRPGAVTNLINIGHERKGNCPYNLGENDPLKRDNVLRPAQEDKLELLHQA